MRLIYLTGWLHCWLHSFLWNQSSFIFLKDWGWEILSRISRESLSRCSILYVRTNTLTQMKSQILALQNTGHTIFNLYSINNDIMFCHFKQAHFDSCNHTIILLPIGPAQAQAPLLWSSSTTSLGRRLKPPTVQCGNCGCDAMTAKIFKGARQAP